MFGLYFELGIDHILDINGIDHLLFIISICAVFEWVDIKKILFLVTAFTVGHSVTLALSTLNWISISSSVVERLIPVTILLSALSNLLWTQKLKTSIGWFHYPLATLFGLIHGLGFSNYLKSLLGLEETIILPLFAFNIGLEVGQLTIVAGYLLITSFTLKVYSQLKTKWSLIISSMIFGMAVMLLKETFENS